MEPLSSFPPTIIFSDLPPMLSLRMLAPRSKFLPSFGVLLATVGPRGGPPLRASRPFAESQSLSTSGPSACGPNTTRLSFLTNSRLVMSVQRSCRSKLKGTGEVNAAMATTSAVATIAGFAAGIEATFGGEKTHLKAKVAVLPMTPVMTLTSTLHSPKTKPLQTFEDNTQDEEAGHRDQ
eukprot:CAMPEP_0197670626 /NCGR_PEP_ID=MMETSP1338-20131121/74948_1 /TAXON_ID=43686 ORGANISM="Pelagodinium beii, Strain RCC1491" /NCGR_SAMPLE_ID=MMETSP1338 /ASSEMBLY_ACC=CAM_ASM_000754 /LENGTH=178 /DNA_ID=CAMNT_0043250383 /DNA_START=158 /DNA_END=693 /DNA_ORIENTATION=-